VSYLEDWRTVVSAPKAGSRLKRDRLLKKIDKFERHLKEVGGDVNKFPMQTLVEAMCKDSGADPGITSFQMCAARLLRGVWDDWSGWEYRDDWAASSYRKDLPTPRWRMEKVKTLAVVGEQGIGDEILFASCLPDVLKLGIEVTLECDPRLFGVFGRSFGVKCVPRKGLNEHRDEDAFIPIGDLPRLFRKSAESFPGTPFLIADPEMVAKWSHLKGRVGCAWRGRRGKFEAQDFRLADPVCLQYDPWEYETEGMTVPEIDLRDDVEDVLGICANVSRIVTVPQTVVHFAGALGTRVDVVLPPVDTGRVVDQLNWRYGQGKRIPWYSSVRVYRNLQEYRTAWA
jgi:hypothetical protein